MFASVGFLISDSVEASLVEFFIAEVSAAGVSLGAIILRLFPLFRVGTSSSFDKTAWNELGGANFLSFLSACDLGDLPWEPCLPGSGLWFWCGVLLVMVVLMSPMDVVAIGGIFSSLMRLQTPTPNVSLTTAAPVIDLVSSSSSDNNSTISISRLSLGLTGMTSTSVALRFLAGFLRGGTFSCSCKDFGARVLPFLWVFDWLPDGQLICWFLSYLCA